MIDRRWAKPTALAFSLSLSTLACSEETQAPQGCTPGVDCETPVEESPATTQPQDLQTCRLSRLFITTSDYTRGGLALLDRASGSSEVATEPNADQDSAPFEANCQALLLERSEGRLRFMQRNAPFATEKLVEFDPPGATGSYLSNPQKVVRRADGKLYVVLLQRNELLLLDPAAAPETPPTSIDLSPLHDARDLDGVVDANDAVAIGDRLYIALGRYHFDSSFTPRFLAGSVIAVVDMSSQSLVDMDAATPGIQGIDLQGENPWRGLRPNVEGSALWVGSTGRIGPQDGGIESIDLASGQSTGFVLREDQVGGEIQAFEPVNSERLWLVVDGKLQAWNPSSKTAIGEVLMQNVEGIYVIDNELYAWSRSGTGAGLRRFSLDEGVETTPNAAPWTFGTLPIYGVAAVP